METRHEVYTALFTFCPLTDAHLDLLMGPAHHLTSDQTLRYHSLPTEAEERQGIVAALEAKYGRNVLLSIPGFTRLANGTIDLPSPGLLFPARDADGRIQALQRRLDDATRSKRYLWVSRKDGVGSGAPCHVAQPANGVTDEAHIIVCEGIKGADLVADATGCVTIGVTGHGNWRPVIPALESLLARGIEVETVIVALDADDPESKPQTVTAVEQSRQALAAAIHALGLCCKIARWPHEAGKGADDLLSAGHSWATTRWRPEQAPTTPECPTVEVDTTDAARKLTALSDVIQNGRIKPSTKVVLLNSMIKANAYPGQPRDKESAHVYVAAIADSANVSRGLAGRELKNLAHAGVLHVQQTPVRDPDSDKVIGITTRIGAGRRAIGRYDVLDEAPHRAADRERKRYCPSCGSPALKAHTLTCSECTATWTVEQAESEAAERAHAARCRAREQSSDEPAQEDAPPQAAGQDADARCSDSEPHYIDTLRCSDSEHRPATPSLFIADAVAPPADPLTAAAATEPTAPLPPTTSATPPPKPTGPCGTCGKMAWYLSRKWNIWMCDSVSCQPRLERVRATRSASAAAAR